MKEMKEMKKDERTKMDIGTMIMTMGKIKMRTVVPLMIASMFLITTFFVVIETPYS